MATPVLQINTDQNTGTLIWPTSTYEVLDITNDIFFPTHSETYGKELQYNETSF